ncbi:MAG: two-component system response regulator [Gemmatimonadetes bacterium]|nr:two-component system response regulator [Gemmatimonadota bacterium]
MMQRILIVDDDANILKILRFKLERAGYRVETACNGAIAVESIKLAPPDLVLLDIMMPEMDGIELVGRLRGHAEWRTIPVFVVTARGQMADKKIAFRLGVEDYITKPFSPAEVVDRVRAFFEDRNRRKSPSD